MGVTAAVIASTVIGAVGTGVAMNQQKQAAKGAANAASDQTKQAQLALTTQQAKDTANLNQQGEKAAGSQQAALAAIRASMTASGSSGGTILTGPGGAAPAPTQAKTLLGA